LEDGLRFSPANFTLLNNYAYALAHLNNVSKAKSIISKLNPDELSSTEKPVLKATTGLIAFRQGDVDNGKILYKQAIDSFRILKQVNNQERAKLCLIREELRIAKQDHTSILKEVEDIGKKSNRPDIKRISMNIVNEFKG
jgi:hypothetical protein